MVEESGSDHTLETARLLNALETRLQTPKAELVAEIEISMTELLGVEVAEAFQAVAVRQQHNARSMNLDRVHKSALVLVAHVLAEAVKRAEDV